MSSASVGNQGVLERGVGDGMTEELSVTCTSKLPGLVWWCWCGYNNMMVYANNNNNNNIIIIIHYATTRASCVWRKRCESRFPKNSLDFKKKRHYPHILCCIFVKPRKSNMWE